MASYKVSPGARRDLKEIWKYIAEDDVKAADALYDRFFEVFVILGCQPGIGLPVPTATQDIRKFPVGKYLIYYREIQRGLQILHVFHGQRDQRKLLRNAD